MSFSGSLLKAAVLCCLCFAMCLSGCLSRSDTVATDVSPRGWSTSVTMTYDNRDTLSQKSATLFLRHDHRIRSGEYAVEFRAPSGMTVIRDTFAIELPRELRIPPRPRPFISINWKWPYRRRIQLREEGEWLFIVTPLQETRGVWSVGIDLSKPLEPLPHPLPQDRLNNQVN